MLFERYGVSGKNGQRFYACSACRDRKECNFFQLENSVVSKATKRARAEDIEKHRPKYTHEQYYQRFLKVKESDAVERKFCHTCHLLLLPNEWNDHKTHLMRENLTDDDLRNPSKLFTPLESNKSHAQFLFSDGTNDFLLSCIKKLTFTNILCIGTPRLHEAILMLKKEGNKEHLQSLLLDMDHRFMQFFGTNEFCHYNMFNHHFFDNKKSRDVFESFMRKEDSKTLIVMDPPFGGMVEILAHSLKTISCPAGAKENVKILPTLFFFPYYLQPRVSQYLPDFSMSDYRVNYINHDSYQCGPKGRKHGSPVRFFTNINLKDIHVPEEQEYRWCSLCEMSVHATNNHCEKCNSCTSKDGSVYKHCDICQRCVKPSRIHCDTCNMCVQQDHRCGQILSVGCHICGEQGHKRRECPKRHEIWSDNKAKKRKQTEKGAPKKKLRKLLKRQKRKH